MSVKSEQNAARYYVEVLFYLVKMGEDHDRALQKTTDLISALGDAGKGVWEISFHDSPVVIAAELMMWDVARLDAWLKQNPISPV